MKTLLAIALWTAGACAAADSASAVSLDRGYDQMYNGQFEDAHKTFRGWEAAHPASPLGPVSEAAAYLFGELNRLHILQSEFFIENRSSAAQARAADPAVKERFLKELERTEQLSAASPGTDADAQFAVVLDHGLRSDYLALVERRQVAALREIKQGRGVAERLLAAHPDCYDANFAIGMENYLLSARAAVVRFVLRSGGAEADRQTGIEKLRLTAEKGRYVAPFARLMLAVAAIREKDYEVARTELNALIARYPRNELLREELARIK